MNAFAPGDFITSALPNAAQDQPRSKTASTLDKPGGNADFDRQLREAGSDSEGSRRSASDAAGRPVNARSARRAADNATASKGAAANETKTKASANDGGASGDAVAQEDTDKSSAKAPGARHEAQRRPETIRHAQQRLEDSANASEAADSAALLFIEQASTSVVIVSEDQTSAASDDAKNSGKDCAAAPDTRPNASGAPDLASNDAAITMILGSLLGANPLSQGHSAPEDAAPQVQSAAQAPQSAPTLGLNEESAPQAQQISASGAFGAGQSGQKRTAQDNAPQSAVNTAANASALSSAALLARQSNMSAPVARDALKSNASAPQTQEEAVAQRTVDSQIQRPQSAFQLHAPPQVPQATADERAGIPSFQPDKSFVLAEAAKSAEVKTDVAQFAHGPAPVSGSPSGAPQSVMSAGQPAHTNIITVAQNVTRMARGLNGGGGARIEIRLDPVELGRIDARIEMNADKSVSLTLSADRPETLADLMRSSRQLERQLAESGLRLSDDGVKFRLNSDARGGQGQQNANDNAFMQQRNSRGFYGESEAAPDAVAQTIVQRWRLGALDVWA